MRRDGGWGPVLTRTAVAWWDEFGLAMTNQTQPRIAIIGLGYVGLPLAVEVGERRPVIGLDIDLKRIESLRAGHDRTLQVTDGELAHAVRLVFADALGKPRHVLYDLKYALPAGESDLRL